MTLIIGDEFFEILDLLVTAGLLVLVYQYHTIWSFILLMIIISFPIFKTISYIGRTSLQT